MTFTYREKALKAGRNYTVTDVPPLGTSILLGVQHYLTMLGATVSSVLFFVFAARENFGYSHPLVDRSPTSSPHTHRVVCFFVCDPR